MDNTIMDSFHYSMGIKTSTFLAFMDMELSFRGHIYLSKHAADFTTSMDAKGGH